MPKPQPFENESDKDEELEAIRSKIQDSEKRFAKVLEKRNELNDTARRLRDERDALNAQKKHLVGEMRRLQAERDRINAEAREARDKRNMAQGQAKALIAAKQQRRAQGAGGYAGKVRELEAEIKTLQFKQETSTMSVHEENDLIDKIKALTKELEQARVQYADETALLAEVKDIDQKIDELFRTADEWHKVVVEKSNAAQAFHDQIGPILQELKFLDQQSDAKHKACIAAREQANEQHEKALAMREDVMKARGERQDVFRERRDIIREHQQTVRTELFDEEKLEGKADEAVKLLLAKGRVRL